VGALAVGRVQQSLPGLDVEAEGGGVVPEHGGVLGGKRGRAGLQVEVEESLVGAGKREPEALLVFAELLLHPEPIGQVDKGGDHAHGLAGGVPDHLREDLDAEGEAVAALSGEGADPVSGGGERRDYSGGLGGVRPELGGGAPHHGGDIVIAPQGQEGRVGIRDPSLAVRDGHGRDRRVDCATLDQEIRGGTHVLRLGGDGRFARACRVRSGRRGHGEEGGPEVPGRGFSR
jgi:hypothetical protein